MKPLLALALLAACAPLSACPPPADTLSAQWEPAPLPLVRVAWQPPRSGQVLYLWVDRSAWDGAAWTPWEWFTGLPPDEQSYAYDVIWPPAAAVRYRVRVVYPRCEQVSETLVFTVEGISLPL